MSILFSILREHSTRVDFSVPLRESFALPFIYLQILSICFYLSIYKEKLLRVSYFYLIFINTTL